MIYIWMDGDKQIVGSQMVSSWYTKRPHSKIRWKSDQESHTILASSPHAHTHMCTHTTIMSFKDMGFVIAESNDAIFEYVAA